MKTEIESKLDDFLSDNDEKNNAFNEKVKNDKAKFVKQNFGLIERLDPIILIDGTGKQLLREQY